MKTNEQLIESVNDNQTAISFLKNVLTFVESIDEDKYEIDIKFNIKTKLRNSEH